MTCAYEFIASKDNVECVVQKKPNKRVLAAKPLSKSDIMVPVSSNFKLLKDGERAEMIPTVTFKGTDYKFAVVAPTSSCPNRPCNTQTLKSLRMFWEWLGNGFLVSIETSLRCWRNLLYDVLLFCQTGCDF